jgi:hypothetical protein
MARRLKEFPDCSSVDIIDLGEIVATLDRLDIGPRATETTVKGYKVKVTRQALSHEELSGKRSAIAEVIARSLRKP